MRLLSLVTCFSLLVTLLPGPARSEMSKETLIESGNRLAAVLRAGRSVVSGNQELINNPDIGDKGLTAEVFLDQVKAAYEERNNEPPLADGLSDFQRQLIEAQLDAMGEVISEAQDQINAEGLAFKGFIPAVFARLTNERFGEKVGDMARVKVTAPPDYVRNRKARPDDWELSAIEDKFLSASWDKGAAYEEMVEGDDGSIFRMILPEYYSASCLTCHGGPKGEVDVTGFPKEGGSEGALGGAISITLRP
jgi:hypothetical protein